MPFPNFLNNPNFLVINDFFYFLPGEYASG